jgi:hypothetical protein
MKTGYLSTKHSCHALVYWLSLALFLATGSTAMGFDDNKNISDIHLKDESFLDINAHQFRKYLDLAWLSTRNGWRATGGSVSNDRLFYHMELRLQKDISRSLSFGMELNQENFYAKAPQPLPLIFADVYPSSLNGIGISFIGTPAYDKRQADIGYAITFGRRPTNYTRFSWLKIDTLYNDKNEFDNSFYERYGETWKLEGMYQLDHNWNIYFDFSKDTPLNFIFDNQTSRFQHESYDHKLKLIHHISRNSFTGINIRTMNVDKQLQETTNDNRQQLDYYMLDIYWTDTSYQSNKELTLGFRYDIFKENLADIIDQNNSYKFELNTWQAYSSLNHTYSTHQAWDLGLYLAWSERSRQYNTNSINEYDDSGIQAKLRTSWQYHSIDKTSVLLFSMSFNLDDLIDDPGDGGGIYFQSSF